MADFFISYNKADRAWAEWIAWQLEEANYSTVFQAWDFMPGSNFVLEMQRATSESERTIAVLSPDYLASLYTQPEWAAAFAQDPMGEKGILLLARVRKCEIKGLLRAAVYIDLFALDEAAANKALLEGVKRERKETPIESAKRDRAKPVAAPGFPGKQPRSVPQKLSFPGATATVWNVPHLRNPNFTGREQLLADLKAALHSGQPAALTQAIHGLGGVGKTQLAVEYAYRNSADYNVVWWVRAEQSATLVSDFAGLATKLDLPEKEAQDQRVIVEAVREWLRQNKDWLLIFDNATDADSMRGCLEAKQSSSSSSEQVTRM